MTTLSPSPRLLRTVTKPPTFRQIDDVQNMHCGVATIDNTAGRKGDLLQILDDVILSKKLGRVEALRLRGRLQFAAGQFAGRLARKSLNVVTKHAYSMCGLMTPQSPH